MRAVVALIRGQRAEHLERRLALAIERLVEHLLLGHRLLGHGVTPSEVGAEPPRRVAGSRWVEIADRDEAVGEEFVPEWRCANIKTMCEMAPLDSAPAGCANLLAERR
jgi:hypothetical protein